MSSGTVRDAFELAWATLMPGLDLVDADNIEPDRATLPDQWATTDYISFGETRQSLGETACRRETGTIVVVVFVKAGSASSVAVSLCDDVRNAFRDWKDSTGKITILSVNPGETGGASDGRWFAASVNLAYNFDQYI